MNNAVRIATRSLIAILLIGEGRPLVGQTVAPVVFSGRVVDLQGKPRVGVNVISEVRFQNNGQPFNAFDARDPSIASRRKVPYDSSTAEFFLPIRVANTPSGDAGVSLRFIIDNQVISEVNFLSALNSLQLDVVVPDPVPVQPCYPRRRVFRRHRCAASEPKAEPMKLVASVEPVTPTVQQQMPGFRRWTNRAGTKSVVARLVRVQNGKAQFERDDGKLCSTLVADLFTADQQWIENWRSSQLMARASLEKSANSATARP